MSWWTYAIAIWAAGAFAMLMYSFVQIHRVRWGSSETDYELRASMEKEQVTYSDLYQVSLLSAVIWPISVVWLAMRAK